MRPEDKEMYESLFYIMMKPFPDRYDEEIVEPPSEKKTEVNFLLEREILIAKEHENQKELLRKSQISERKLHRQKFYEKVDPRDIKPETFWISSLRSTAMCPNVRDILSGIEPESFKDAEGDIYRILNESEVEPRLTFHDLYKQFQEEEEIIISRHRSQMKGLENYHSRVLFELQKQISRVIPATDLQRLRNQKLSEKESKIRTSTSPVNTEASTSHPTTPDHVPNSTTSSCLPVDASTTAATIIQSRDDMEITSAEDHRSLDVPINQSTTQVNADIIANLSVPQEGANRAPNSGTAMFGQKTDSVNAPSNINPVPDFLMNALNPEMMNLLNAFNNLSGNNQQATTVLLNWVGGLLSAQQSMMNNNQQGNSTINNQHQVSTMDNGQCQNPFSGIPWGPIFDQNGKAAGPKTRNMSQ